MMTTRRKFIALSTSGIAMVLAGGTGRRAGAAASFEVTRSETEWRAMLTQEQFAVLREEGTEKPYSSPLNDEKRAGTYHCAGCDLAVYASEHKYESGTGWPSFWQPLPDAVATKADWGIFGKRTEVHCRRCGGHLGHVFNDGPQPTGKRYCMNGVAMVFRAA